LDDDIKAMMRDMERDMKVIWEVILDYGNNFGDPSERDERNQFILEQYKSGTLLKVIMSRVNANPRWTSLRTISAVLHAMHDYCGQEGLDIPIRKQMRSCQAGQNLPS
jgi:hypothetical protein